MWKIVRDFLIQLLVDAVFGLVAALFAHLILCNIVPSILTLNFNGVVNLSLTFPEQWYKLFSYWNCFFMLFGIRFVIAYLMGSYKFSSEKAMANKISNKIMERF